VILKPTLLLPLSIPLIFVLILSALLAGCGHKSTPLPVPEPPSLPQARTVPAPPTVRVPAKDVPGSAEKIDIPEGAKTIFEETGIASWYGAPYHNRRASNGEVYNMHAMTAAHLTLPLGSIVRVTNLKTGHSALVRITDRGPFVAGRVIDLSLAAAKALDVYLPGTAQVRLEVLKTPVPLDSGGRWTVQIGDIAEAKDAADLADYIQQRYQTAKVSKFLSPVGRWWVRVRVPNDDRQRAIAVAKEIEIAAGAVFLVRLD
jgi:rare lipoprotein A